MSTKSKVGHYCNTAAIWRPLPFAPDYFVSARGDVLSLKQPRPRVMRPVPTREGYLRVCLAGRWFYVHRLVLMAFVGPPPPDDHVADHLDFDVANNRVGNLRWLPNRENAGRKRSTAHLFA